MPTGDAIYGYRTRWQTIPATWAQSTASTLALSVSNASTYATTGNVIRYQTIIESTPTSSSDLLGEWQQNAIYYHTAERTIRAQYLQECRAMEREAGGVIVDDRLLVVPPPPPPPAPVEVESWRVAHERAMALLRSVLSPAQRTAMERDQAFIVIGSGGRRFRIRTTSMTGNIEELNAAGEAIMRYCVHPNGVPLGDALLTQKLMLETDERSILAVANRHPVVRENVRAA